MKRDKNENKLISALQRLIFILKEHGETDWKEWFEKDLAALRRNDRWATRSAIRHIEQAYGGMGSFTDLVVPGPDGDKLYELSAEILELTRAIR